MKWWRILLIACAAILIFLVVDHWYEKRAQAKRDASYEAAIRSYSEQFHLGMTRKMVEDYFRAKGITVQQIWTARSLNSWTDMVQVGRDPAPWYCSAYGVYVAFDFAANPPHGSGKGYDSDVLQRVRLERMGLGCL